MSNESRLGRAVFRWCALAVLAGAVLYLAWIYRSAGSAGIWEILGYAGVSLAVVGKFVIFAGLNERAPSPWTLALLVWLMDLGFAFLLASGLETLERAPLLGQGLRKARGRALEVLADYPRLERMAFFGVALFVFLPLAGTGAITGSFLARIFGLSRLDGVAAIALGSAFTATIFACLAQFVGAQAETFLKSPVLVSASVLILLFLGWRAYLRFLGKLKA